MKINRQSFADNIETAHESDKEYQQQINQPDADLSEFVIQEKTGQKQRHNQIDPVGVGDKKGQDDPEDNVDRLLSQFIFIEQLYLYHKPQ